jgi:hypothetical protein
VKTGLIIYLLVFVAAYDGKEYQLWYSRDATQTHIETFAARTDKPTCKSILDTLSKMVVYTEADIWPENEGGIGAIMRKLNKSLSLGKLNFEEGYNSNHLIAFIVDTDGSIKAGRVLEMDMV